MNTGTSFAWFNLSVSTPAINHWPSSFASYELIRNGVKKKTTYIHLQMKHPTSTAFIGILTFDFPLCPPPISPLTSPVSPSFCLPPAPCHNAPSDMSSTSSLCLNKSLHKFIQAQANKAEGLWLKLVNGPVNCADEKMPAEINAP